MYAGPLRELTLCQARTTRSKSLYGFAYCSSVITASDTRPVNETNPPSAQRERFYRRERRSVPAARQFVREAVIDWALCDRLDDVLLCVSEPATNALVHGVPPGRGLMLVAALADKWGVGERDPGKIVWCEFVI